MKKYLALLKYEFKTLFKDAMSMFMILFPLIIVFIMGFVIPAILEKTAGTSSQTVSLTLLIGFAVTLSMGGFIGGAILGFSLLENKDEHTLVSIAVTPVKIEGYITFKLIYSYFLSVISNLITIFGIKLIALDKYVITLGGQSVQLLGTLQPLEIIVFSFVSSLVVPMFALVIGAVAKNKIEGFALMKSLGLFLMIPVLTLLNYFSDAKQYLLGIIPNFWVMKAILNEVFSAMGTADASNMGFYGYMIVGAIYSLVVGYISLRFFLKKTNLSS